MARSVVPGTYLGKVKNYGITTTQAGEPQVAIQFGLTTPEGQKTLTWHGTLKEGKGREITLGALLNCGFRGDDISALADGVDGGALDTDREVDLVVEDNTPPGKTEVYSKVRWVNRTNTFEGLSQVGGQT
jgi:hypothetical protein